MANAVSAAVASSTVIPRPTPPSVKTPPGKVEASGLITGGTTGAGVCADTGDARPKATASPASACFMVIVVVSFLK